MVGLGVRAVGMNVGLHVAWKSVGSGEGLLVGVVGAAVVVGF